MGDGDTLDEFLFQRPHSALCDLLGVPSGVNGVNVSAFRSVVGGLLLALKEIHGRGIVHRDVKPANILLAAPRRGENPFKLIDFGSSADIRSLFWNRGVNTLDPLFAAPEQRLNVLGPEKFDVFSVGMIGAAVLLPQLASEARLREFRSALEAVDYDLRCVQGMENLQNEAADVWSLLCAMLKKSPGNRKSVNSALSDLGIL